MASKSKELRSSSPPAPAGCTEQKELNILEIRASCRPNLQTGFLEFRFGYCPTSSFTELATDEDNTEWWAGLPLTSSREKGSFAKV